jgi:hypothetical protein
VKATRTPRVSTAGMKTSEIILQSLGAGPEAFFALDATDDTDAVALKSTMDTVLAKIDSLDKKSKEKALGVFSAVRLGKRPSVYIMHTIEALTEGSMTLKSLTAWLMEKRNYKLGTASRQAQQMFALLPLLKITKRASERGAPMELNANSSLLAAFKNAS